MSAAAVGVDVRVPADLTERDQWLLRRDIRGRKVPFQASGRPASSTDPTTWCAFEAAAEAYAKHPDFWSGLGFVFSESDPFAGIDLDDCLDEEGNVKEWARGVVQRFADTYMETSPGGRGIKIWARGALPANLPGVKVGDGAIELYDHARYFAVTGRPFRGAPLQVEDHAADLLVLYEGLTGGKKKAWPLQPLEGGRIPYGQQHSTLVSIAGTLRARRVCDEAIEVCLQTVNRLQCERPGSPENISHIVRSTRTWGAK